ncbi:MAG: leucine-rich repeat protein [Treponemataceae bacterium]
MKKMGLILNILFVCVLLISCADVVSANIHYVTIDKNVAGGKIIINSSTFKVGERVNIEIQPDTGLIVEPASLKYLIDQKAVPIKYNYFYMPATNVSITVNFIAENNTYMEINRNNAVFQGSIKLDAAVQNSDSLRSNTNNWVSSNPTIAAVNQEGFVTSLSPGKAVITVSNEYSGVSAACVVEVPEIMFSASRHIVTGVVFDANIVVESLTIPEVVNNIVITEIAANAFKNKTSVREIFIPNTIKTIGECAFENIAINSVSIPASVESIGSSAFANNNNLSSVLISSEKPPTISSDTFNSRSLSSIIVPAGKSPSYKKNWFSYGEIIKEF